MWSRLSGRGLVIALAVAVILAVFPTPVPLHIILTWAAARESARDGDTVTAARALEEVQLSSAWLPAMKADAIRLALANGNADLARDLLDRPPSPMASAEEVACWLAEAEVSLGQWQAATVRLAASDTSTCDAPIAALKALARQELKSGNLSIAESMLQHLVSLHPGDAEALSLLGALLALEDPAEARTVLQHARSLGDSLAAELAAAIGPGTEQTSASLSAVGQVLLKHALWPLAAEAFARLILLEPGNAAAHAYYGLALDQGGHDGLSELESAARLDPSSAVAQSTLGLHWQLRNEPQKAIVHLERAVELEPGNSAFRASLAAAQAQTGDLQSALAEFRLAAQLQPADPIFWNLLAGFSISQELQLADTGLPAARNALVLDTDNPDTLDHAAYAHFLLGDRVTAERLILRCLSIDPMSASARLHYGLLLSEAGRLDEARAQLASAAKIGGDGPEGQHAQRALAQLGY